MDKDRDRSSVHGCLGAYSVCVCVCAFQSYLPPGLWGSILNHYHHHCHDDDSQCNQQDYRHLQWQCIEWMEWDPTTHLERRRAWICRSWSEAENTDRGTVSPKHCSFGRYLFDFANSDLWSLTLASAVLWDTFLQHEYVFVSTDLRQPCENVNLSYNIS